MNNDCRQLCAFSTGSRYEDVRHALNTVISAVDGHIDSGDCAAIELCLAEAINNIIEHAYEERDDGVIELEVNRVGGEINFRLFDYGKPRPNGIVPRSLDDAAKADELWEGGYGLALIEQIASRVDYTRVENKNLTSIWKKV